MNNSNSLGLQFNVGNEFISIEMLTTLKHTHTHPKQNAKIKRFRDNINRQCVPKNFLPHNHFHFNCVQHFLKLNVHIWLPHYFDKLN